ncbi:MAG: hypothetical protein H6679_03825 [Epsilonproteobacteria bacterium]|nr:hypothetical protein [Campylobacterota bacterium]
MCVYAFLLLLPLYFFSTQAVSIDGTVTPSHVTSTHLFSNADAATGFVRFAKGFSLNPSSTVVLDLAGVPVSGPLSWAASTAELILRDDLYLDSDLDRLPGELTGGTANIIGEGNTLHLGGNVQLDGLGIRLSASHDTSITIDGHGHKLAFKGNIIDFRLGGISALTHTFQYGVHFKNIILEEFDTSLSFLGFVPKVTFTFEDTVILPISGFSFLVLGNGNTTIIGDVLIALRSVGAGTKSGVGGNQEKLLIKDNSTLRLEENLILSLNGTEEFADGSSRLSLRGTVLSLSSTLLPTSNNINLQKGTLIVEREAEVDSLAAVVPALSSLIFGDGVSGANNFNVDILPSSKLIINDFFAGAGKDVRLVYNNTV